jgi:hypothetical protein
LRSFIIAAADGLDRAADHARRASMTSAFSKKAATLAEAAGRCKRPDVEGP